MRFNSHSDLKDRHSFFSASKYHWLNDDDDKLIERFDKHMDAALGSRFHVLAAELILMGVHLADNGLTLNRYVNDCIGYRMQPEQTLFYTYDAFATCDAIWFGPDPEDPDGPLLLRIFDLKNGVSPAKRYQLEVYAAYFCIEYKIRPGSIKYDLRIYQNDAVAYFETTPDDIAFIMDRIKTGCQIVEKRKEVL